MPSNPTRSSQGGDVEGETPIDVTMGDALKVSKACYDPGYDIGTSMPDTSKADLKGGYCSYGRSIGEGK